MIPADSENGLSGHGDWLIVGNPTAADLDRLVEYRDVDGRPTVWNRSTLSDDNPFPHLRVMAPDWVLVRSVLARLARGGGWVRGKAHRATGGERMSKPPYNRNRLKRHDRTEKFRKWETLSQRRLRSRQGRRTNRGKSA